MSTTASDSPYAATSPSAATSATAAATPSAAASPSAGTEQPIATLHSVVLDCPDPAALAEFYRKILGGSVTADGDDWVDLVSDGPGAQLAFQESPGYIAPVWPGDDGDQQVHLDVAVEDLEAAHNALLAIGAEHLESHDTFRVYRDPVGHPFCTVR
ncbi:VOC family protein [Leucobacter sp. USHLN153]|uniref:VOC family protein n=1 Tax=Leucobacter sp. USHLN153 TaxID=3081268 RepID=UPI003018B3B3